MVFVACGDPRRRHRAGLFLLSARAEASDANARAFAWVRAEPDGGVPRLHDERPPREKLVHFLDAAAELLQRLGRQPVQLVRHHAEVARRMEPRVLHVPAVLDVELGAELRQHEARGVEVDGRALDVEAVVAEQVHVPLSQRDLRDELTSHGALEEQRRVICSGRVDPQVRVVVGAVADADPVHVGDQQRPRWRLRRRRTVRRRTGR
mmetsp:Transcript_10251/g.31662  ORF Transcript_10251/g.31662 Transcript_10251/m.31662 type:complete len:207 (+) Transcript_10251:218-838(+)